MIVVKYGGHALPKAGVPDEMLKVIASYAKSGKEIVLVHGGGPQVDAELEIHGIESEMVWGYRRTTPEIFEVVQAVLSGQVCRTLVNQLIGYGANAVGLSSSDGGSIRATKMTPEVNGAPLDIGLPFQSAYEFAAIRLTDQENKERDRNGMSEGIHLRALFMR